MQVLRLSPQQWILLVGDTLVLALVTLFGFARHGTLGSAGLRPLTTFLPLFGAWLLVAPLVQAFDISRAAGLRQLWRPFWAMVFAAPLAGFLRALWLDVPVQPVFVIVLGGVSASALAAWRLARWFLLVREKGTHG